MVKQSVSLLLVVLMLLLQSLPAFAQEPYKYPRRNTRPPRQPVSGTYNGYYLGRQSGNPAYGQQSSNYYNGRQIRRSYSNGISSTAPLGQGR